MRSFHLKGGIAAALFLLGVFGAPMASCNTTSGFPQTALFADLSGLDFDDGQALLRGRVEQRYNVGASEQGLDEYLQSQGMKTRRITNSEAPAGPIYGEATAKADGVCDRVVHVNWRASRDRIITDLLVAYGDEGCL